MLGPLLATRREVGMEGEQELDEYIDEEREPDPFLGLFVRAANAGEGNVGVTLWVGGAIVTGMVVGTDEFFDALADYVEGDTGETASTFRKVATELREDRDAAKAVVAEDGLGDDPVTFIHLRDARAFAPGSGPIPSNQGFLWRGRLDTVDAWSFGVLSVDRG
jgi:hypothetical protein